MIYIIIKKFKNLDGNVIYGCKNPNTKEEYNVIGSAQVFFDKDGRDYIGYETNEVAHEIYEKMIKTGWIPITKEELEKKTGLNVVDGTKIDFKTT